MVMHKTMPLSITLPFYTRLRLTAKLSRRLVPALNHTAGHASSVSHAYATGPQEGTLLRDALTSCRTVATSEKPAWPFTAQMLMLSVGRTPCQCITRVVQHTS